MQPDFSKIPSMDTLLNRLHDQTKLIDLNLIKELLDNLLNDIKNNPSHHKILEKNREEIHEFIQNELKKTISKYIEPSFRHVINGTGVILHTGLGRAPLSTSSLTDISEVLGYTNLEINRMTGKRGERLNHVSDLLSLLTGAEESVVVNNNAAAVLLVLNSLARRKEVIVSRGELVEIGGSFRMPEIMNSSGAKMIEVGSTNKTHLHDYSDAITAKTGAILLVHTSNYKVIGFTEKPDIRDIVSLAGANNIPVIFDLGSGAFIDLNQFGFDQEPIVKHMVSMGCDVITFSGDKLLGGPQAGIIIGKNNYLDKIKKNHLLRALRCDKISLALLSSTLRQYLHLKDIAEKNITLQLFLRSKNKLKEISELLLSLIDNKYHDQLKIVEDDGKAGSGAYPVQPIPSLALQIKNRKSSAEKLSKQLRLAEPPIFGYIRDDLLHINLLAILEEDIPDLAKTLNNIL